MKQRLAEFDMIRTIAALAVIGIHVSASWALSTPGGFVFNQLVRFAVPLFIIISGYLLFYQEASPMKSESAINFIKNRFGRIMWPYFIWTLIYTVLNQFLLHKTVTPALFAATVVRHLLLGTANYHLYFMVIIVQFYLLYPILRQMLVRHPGGTLTGAFLINAVVQMLLYLQTIGIYHLPAIRYPDIYLVAFPGWLFYFIFGMYTAKNKTALEQWLQSKTPIMGLLWITSLGLLLLESSMTRSLASSNKPTILLYTTTSYFFLYSAALMLSRFNLNWVQWMSKQSFLIYLAHPIILLVLQRLAGPNPALWAGMAGMVTQYCLTVVITCMVVYALARVPFVGYLGGYRASRSVSE